MSCRQTAVCVCTALCFSVNILISLASAVVYWERVFDDAEYQGLHSVSCTKHLYSHGLACGLCGGHLPLPCGIPVMPPVLL